jgi:hypothetical protein
MVSFSNNRPRFIRYPSSSIIFTPSTNYSSYNNCSNYEPLLYLDEDNYEYNVKGE